MVLLKIVSLFLPFLLVFPVYAQEPSFDDQLTASEEYSGLVSLTNNLEKEITNTEKRIDELEFYHNNLVTKIDTLQTQVLEIKNNDLKNINSTLETILNKITYDALGVTSVAASLLAILLAGLIYRRQNRQNTNIETLVTDVEDMLRTDKELRDSKKEHEEKELVHALIFTKSRLQLIVNTIEQMDEERASNILKLKLIGNLWVKLLLINWMIL